MIIRGQDELRYINSKNIAEFKIDCLKEEKKYAIIAKLNYGGEPILATYADREQAKEEFARFMTALATEDDKMFFFAAEKESEPEKEKEEEAEAVEEPEQTAAREINIDEIIESLREILKAARIQRLLNRAEDIRYIDEWIKKEEENEHAEHRN